MSVSAANGVVLAHSGALPCAVTLPGLVPLVAEAGGGALPGALALAPVTSAFGGHAKAARIAELDDLAARARAVGLPVRIGEGGAFLNADECAAALVARGGGGGGGSPTYAPGPYIQSLLDARAARAVELEDLEKCARAADLPVRCARCKTTPYCGAPCQKAPLARARKPGCAQFKLGAAEPLRLRGAGGAAGARWAAPHPQHAVACVAHLPRLLTARGRHRARRPRC